MVKIRYEDDFGKMKCLITGGLGSLGNQLIEAKKDVWEIGILDNDECRQWEVRSKHPKCKYYLGDVRDRDSLYMIKDYDIVIHAAALKRIEICESSSWEAVKTNIIGTKNVIDECKKHNIKLVYISTDKAVEPVNFYGFTKGIAERMCLYAGYNVVRYGNVFGSRGSVIPIFFNQKKEGKPLTLRDPDMTRFILTLEQAIDLIDQAINDYGESRIWIRKSPSVTTREIAEEFGGDYTTSPPLFGEKKHETLVTSEELRRSVEGADYFIITPNLIYNKYNKPYDSENTEKITKKELRRLMKPWKDQL